MKVPPERSFFFFFPFFFRIGFSIFISARAYTKTKTYANHPHKMAFTLLWTTQLNPIKKSKNLFPSGYKECSGGLGRFYQTCVYTRGNTCAIFFFYVNAIKKAKCKQLNRSNEPTITHWDICFVFFHPQISWYLLTEEKEFDLKGTSLQRLTS